MATPALRSLHRYGPFFALDVPAGTGSVGVCEPELQPLLVARMSQVRERTIGDSQDRTLVRACASLVHLDVLSRLLSPALGLAVAGASLPAPEGVTVTAGETGVRFGLRAWPGGEQAAGPEGFGVALATAEILTAAVNALVGLPAAVTRSNTASAVAGAALVIGAHDRELGAAAIALLGGLLAGPLRGAGRLLEPGAQSGDAARFRRDGCCLYYRLPGGGLCGDCVLTPGSVRA